MSDQQPAIPSREEAYMFLHITPNPDGSITRPKIPTRPTSPVIDPDSSADQAQAVVLSKDIPLNPDKNTFIRLFRPTNPPPNTKLPLIIYFHGGGFIFYSAASAMLHESCNGIAAKIPAIIASVDYRLAPEHRLPAAYDDAVEAVLWAKAQASGGEGSDPWMVDLADFSSVFLLGSSAGANILYHTALRVLDLDLEPLKIVGLVLSQPFFGGVRRTESELRLFNDSVVPLHVSDLMWSLSLPEGADRGHEFCDPFGGDYGEKIGKLPACLVRGYTGDPLVDRQKEFALMLAARGVRVETEIVEGGKHGAELVDAKLAEATRESFKRFVFSVKLSLMEVLN